MNRSLVHLVVLLGVINILGCHAANLACNVTSSDWTAIHTALRERVFYDQLQTAGNLCANATVNPDGLLGNYGTCTSKTLEQALVAQGLESNCRTFLEGILYTGEGENDETPRTRAIEICSSQNLAVTIKNYLCNPLRTVGCPRQLDIIKFAVFTKCYTSPLANLTTPQQEQYFADGKDVQCMKDNKVCKDIAIWATCPLKVQTVLDFIDESRLYTCSNTFTTVEERCDDSYRTNFELYCPPPTLLQQHFYTIVVTCTVGPVAIVAFVLFIRKMYRAQHISADEVLQQAREVGSGSIKLYHPELAAIVASKYKGVSFNPATGEWSVAGKSEKFQDEQAAARFAYINLAGIPDKSANSGTSHTSYSTPRSGIVSNDFPVSAYQNEETEYVVTAKPMSPEQIKERRLKQLISFYEYWEPSKPDIAAHAENLLNRHDFEHVARAVKTKYGVLPPGWTEELEV